MKKLFFTLLLVVSAVGLSTAQTNYYPNESGTFSGDGYTMKYTSIAEGLAVKLYNADQKFVFTETTYKDGRPLPRDIAFGDTKVYLYSGANISKVDLFEAIKTLLSPEELNYLRTETHYDLRIKILIDTETEGKVTDVWFDLMTDSKYLHIPPSTYHKIEEFIKEHLRFTLTDEAAEFNYAHHSWAINFYDYNPL